jgi:TRAP-type C4-dicarboxylate transport system permease small subunit
MEEATRVLWWARFIFFSAVAAFFLQFGVNQMVLAYRSQHPAEFLVSFFSASFIILISGTLLFAFIWRMVMRVRERKKTVEIL